jgi:hypothetical protein
VKFPKIDYKKTTLYLMRLFWKVFSQIIIYLNIFFKKVFSKFPRWLKLLTIIIFLILTMLTIQGIQNWFQKLTSPSPEVVISPISSPVALPPIDQFSDGVNKATNAAKLAQNAKTLDQWNKVVTEWQAAINFMKTVSSTSQNYGIAKQRMVTYPKNLAYAQKNVENLKQQQSKLQKGQTIRGQQVFNSLKGIYQVRGGLTPVPVVSVIIPKTGWDKLSQADKINLTMYTQSLISIIKSNPAKYVDISQSAPAYNLLVNKTANICQDCWSIILSNKDSQPYGIDTTVVQGDTPWKEEDPCCRGVKASEFIQKNLTLASGQKNVRNLKKQQSKTDKFSDGVSKATNAAKLSQTAKTLNEWNKVAREWQAAINFMKTVSSTSQNYGVAKQRIVTYSKNLTYAQKNVGNLKKQKSNSSNSTSASNTSTSSSSTSSRTFLGRSETGYELWAGEKCVYVKGITEGDLARLNTDVWGFKDAVKLQTGYKCVLFE